MTIASQYAWVLRDPDAYPTGPDDVLAVLRRLRSGIVTTGAEPFSEEHIRTAERLPDLLPAIERLLRAREEKESVAIFGDYDADGVTSSAILAETLRALGMRPDVRLPHREREGYGVSVAAVRELVPPASLLIVVDNGTSAHEAIREADARGASVIVLDHHAIPSELPSPAFIVNPQRLGHQYPFRDFCAAGLTYTFCAYLLQRLGRPDDIRWLLDLAALGTLADRVPLTGENRQLVSWGLRVLRETRRPGLRALARRAGLLLESCDADDVAFRLVPRINAAGRMDHADLALHLLQATDAEEAERLAEQLELLNAERKRVTEQVTARLREDVIRAVPLPSVLCVAGEWPVGILGILAGRLVDETGRIACVVSIGATECVASLRGNGTAHVVELLKGIGPLLTRYGGHAEAAGCTFPRTVLSEVQHYFQTLVLPDQEARALELDCRLPPQSITPELIHALGDLEPHGQGNERPVFLLEQLRVDDLRELRGNAGHWRFRLQHAGGEGSLLSAIAFRWGERTLPSRGAVVDIATELSLDTFRGRASVDLRLRDLRAFANVRQSSARSAVVARSR